MGSDADIARYRQALAEVRKLRRLVRLAEVKYRLQMARTNPDYRESAKNLVHYVALRSHDISRLQDLLADLGLSSLGRCELHVDGTLGAVESVLETLSRRTAREGVPLRLAGAAAGRALLDAHAAALLGTAPARRYTRIMVTMPSDAGDDPALIEDLLNAGMNCIRINCAHDGPAEWAAMVRQLRLSTAKTGKECRILMDLAGPKLRTGPVGESPAALRWRPARDSRGRAVEPARIWLRPEGVHELPPEDIDAEIPVDPGWISHLRPGTEIGLTDLRDKRRRLAVTVPVNGGWIAECTQTTYAGNGTLLGIRLASGRRYNTHIRALAPLPEPVLVLEGDVLVLTKEPAPGVNAVRNSDGKVVRAARISCTLPEVFGTVKKGDRVLLDDGKAAGAVVRADRSEIWVEIQELRSGKLKLRADKSINFPDTRLGVPGVTPKDRRDLEFVVQHADLVGVSFIETPADLKSLFSHLDRLGAPDLGVVIKVETRRAFEKLPELMLTAMQRRAAGVMIARGDLAVELGYERLAEVQEEILWAAEAAHLPVIWATEVLDMLARSGMPSRAEVTDAAMGERAECVMLNKGPHIVRTAAFLDDILRRMERHQWKKVPRFGRLRSWGREG